MTVALILSEKGGNVITAAADASLMQIASTLSENRIGAIVIVDNDKKVCGIISERDIVRHVAKMGVKGLDMQASSCMTSKVISATQNDTIDSVMAVMTTNRFRHLPVMDDGGLLGIISIGDVVKHKINQAERDAEELKRYIAG